MAPPVTFAGPTRGRRRDPVQEPGLVGGGPQVPPDEALRRFQTLTEERRAGRHGRQEPAEPAGLEALERFDSLAAEARWRRAASAEAARPPEEPPLTVTPIPERARPLAAALERSLAEQPEPPERGIEVREVGGEFIKGFQTGFTGQNPELAGAALETVGASGLGRRMRAFGRRRVEAAPPRVTDPRGGDVDDWVDWLAYHTGQGFASSVPTVVGAVGGAAAGRIAGGAIGGAVAGPPGALVGQALGAAAGARLGAVPAAAALNIGEARLAIEQEAAEQGLELSESEIRALALFSGTAAAILDTVLPARVAKRVTSIPRQAITRRLIGRAVTETLKGGTIEGLTEGTQAIVHSAVGRYATGQAPLDREAAEQAGLELLVGTIVGTATAGMGEFATGIRAAKEGREAPPEPLSTRVRRRAAEAIFPEGAEERRRAERAAQVDEQTGLGNRRAWEAARQTAEQDPNVAILVFDLNNVKAVNELEGHEAGDREIVRAAEAISEATSTTDMPGRAFRIGGDEFGVLVPADQADAVRNAAEAAFGVRNVQGWEVSLSGAGGQTFQQADDALRARKEEARAPFRPVEPREAAPEPAAPAEAAPEPAVPEVSELGPGAELLTRAGIEQRLVEELATREPDLLAVVDAVATADTPEAVMQLVSRASELAGDDPRLAYVVTAEQQRLSELEPRAAERPEQVAPAQPAAPEGARPTEAAPEPAEPIAGAPTSAEPPRERPRATEAALRELPEEQLDVDPEVVRQQVYGMLDQAAQIREVLSTERNPRTGRKLSPGRLNELREEADELESLAHRMLAEYESTFGAEEADRLRESLDLTERGPVAARPAEEAARPETEARVEPAPEEPRAAPRPTVEELRERPEATVRQLDVVEGDELILSRRKSSGTEVFEPDERVRVVQTARAAALIEKLDGSETAWVGWDEVRLPGEPELEAAGQLRIGEEPPTPAAPRGITAGPEPRPAPPTEEVTRAEAAELPERPLPPAPGEPPGVVRGAPAERRTEEPPRRRRERGERDVRAGVPEPRREEPTAGRGGGEHAPAHGPGAGVERPRPATGERVRGRGRGTNYRITEADALGAGTLKEKARANLEAIELLKTIEQEDRPATPEEQSRLVRYVGWGGLKQVFDPYRGEYRTEAERLQGMLTDEEWNSASASVLNAHYTSKTVISAMWSALERFGLTGGRVLEPSAGVGHFIGLMPEKLAGNSRWTAVELDSITGKIAKLLYPEESVHVRGFEATPMPDNSFDLAISNVPFGDYRVHDPRYNKLRFNIHNYFFAKTLDKVRPGGIVAFITSHYTLDAEDPRARQYIAERTQLLGTIRLPKTAFEKNANTSVTTDILFLRKLLPGEPPTGETWTGTDEITVEDRWGDRVQTPVNEYYARHPEMMLGDMRLDRGLYRDNEPMLVPRAGQDLAQLLKEAVARLPEGAYVPIEAAEAVAQEAAPDIPEELRAPHIKEGSLVVEGGKLHAVEQDKLVSVTIPQSAVARVRALIDLRDTTHDLLRVQRENRPAAEIQEAQKRLNNIYDRFVRRYGPVNLRRGNRDVNLRHFEDPDLPLVAALEIYDPDTNIAKKADIFTKRVIQPRPPVRAETPNDALAASLQERGRVDLEYMNQMSGIPTEQLIADLGGLLYRDPDTGQWVSADEYLSGNVRVKLEVARRAAEADPTFARNVTALEQVQPEDLGPDRIAAKLGATWIEPETIAEFVADLLHTHAHSITVSHNRLTATWHVAAPRWIRDSAESTATWGTEDRDAIDLVNAALNHKQVVVVRYLEDGTKFVDREATALAREKLIQIKERFGTWLWEDAERADRYVRIYNDVMNAVRLRSFDGSHLQIPGQNSAIKLMPHQKNGVWRVVSAGNTLLWHEVGTGKTFVEAATAMEVKRLGLAKKPLIIVPNHMLHQVAGDVIRLFPQAKVLVPSEKDLQQERRRKFVSRVATGDWDVVVMTHSQFRRIPVSPTWEHEFLTRQLWEYRQAMDDARATGDKRTVRDIEKALKNLEARIQELMDQVTKDPGPWFEDTGIDMVIVDEAHEFKNLNFPTKIRALGVQTGKASKRAMDLFAKTEYLHQINHGRGVVLATGTPISNSLSETYVMQRYLQPEALKEAGVSHFDAWAANFGETVDAMELQITGKGFKARTRFNRFVNVNALKQMFLQVADVVDAEEIPGLKRPKLRTGKPEIVQVEASPEMQDFLDHLNARIGRLSAANRREDNMLKISVEGRRSAIDLRLMVPELAEDPNSKINVAADNIYQFWKSGAEDLSTQLVFIDFSAPGPGLNAYEEIKEKLVAKGVPASEIAFFQHAKTDTQKEEFKRRMREGKIRVMLASTQLMGVGANVQTRLKVLHHIDPPWKPAEIEQREGRAWRQGNMNEEIVILRYVTAPSFDAYMWQTLENKWRFIQQFKRAGVAVDTVEDVDARELSAAEAKAVASGNPIVLEKVTVDAEILSLDLRRRAHDAQQIQIRRDLAEAVQRAEAAEEALGRAERDAAKLVDVTGEKFRVTVEDRTFTDRGRAASEIQRLAREVVPGTRQKIGSFAGLDLRLDTSSDPRLEDTISLRGEGTYTARLFLRLGEPDAVVRALTHLPTRVRAEVERQSRIVADQRAREDELRKLKDQPFKDRARLDELLKRQKELDRLLNLDHRDQTEEQYGDEDDDSELRTDPEAGFLDLNIWRRRPDADPIASIFPDGFNPEVEARMRAAFARSPSPSVRQRAAEALAAFKNQWRQFPAIDANESMQMAAIQDLFRQLRSTSEFAKAMALYEIQDIVRGLNKEEAAIFTANLVIPDIIKDVEAGLYKPSDTRKIFGYTNLREMQEHLAHVQALADQNPKIKAALRKRAQFADWLTRRLVNADLLPEHVLADRRYYHRQVLEYFQALDVKFIGTGGRDARIRRKGFQRARVGGPDFNLRYHESEFEWVAQALSMLQRKEILDRIQRLSDITPDLKALAKQVNQQRLVQRLGAEKADELTLPYRQRIAFSNQRLAQMAVDGELQGGGRYNDVVEGLRDALLEWESDDPDVRGPFRFDHDNWFDFLSWLVDEKKPGALQAATIFKAINEREDAIRERLGEDYIDPRNPDHLQGLAPEGYTGWQPEKGRWFFMGFCVTERAAHRLLEEQIPPGAEDLRKQLMVGRKKTTWIVPDGVAKTLDNMEPDIREDAVIENFVRQLVGGWKIWTLFMPLRAIRYNLNNLSGDLDITLAYDPSLVKNYFTQAAKDLWRFHYAASKRLRVEELTPQLKEEIADALRLGVLNSTLTAAEIPDISDIKVFREIMEERPGLEGVVQGYWERVRNFTTWRENVLRLAAYRYFRDKIAAGEDPAGASNSVQLKAIKDPRERAAKLARELIGDYGGISAAGRYMRRTIQPFWSWREINAPRYVRLIRNIKHEGQTDGRNRRIALIAGKRGAVGAAKLLFKMQIYYTLAMMWNWLWGSMWLDDDEKDALLGSRTDLHLILYRGRDGTVRTLRLEGAFADALEWLNLMDYPRKLRELLDGSRTVTEQVADMAHGPIEVIINGWEPFTKTAAEVIFGASSYPSIFAEGEFLKTRFRPIRNRKEHVLRALSLDRLYEHVSSKPKRPTSFVQTVFDALLLYRTDPGEAAYWEIRGAIVRWKRKRGDEPGGFVPTERSTALYYYKRALAWNDEEAAERWLQRYFELGGTVQGIEQSMRLSGPLGGIAQRDQAEFLESLTKREREMLRIANEWWGAVESGAPRRERAPAGPPRRLPTMRTLVPSMR